MADVTGRQRPRAGRAAGRVFGLDLVLLHAPSADVGLTSTAAYLEANNYNVRMVELAYRMPRDPGFDVPARIAALDAPVFGIDLHRLPHANGALGIAELVKKLHPDAKVLLGGLSASYFHEELVDDPAVDFVLRGDSTEEPCRQLLRALREGTPLQAVENLTWKRADGTVVVNPLTFVPADLDWIDVPADDFMPHDQFGCGRLTLVRNVVGAMPREVAKAWARLLRRYDTAVAHPGRAGGDIGAVGAHPRTVPGAPVLVPPAG